MTHTHPPKGIGPLSHLEAALVWGLLAPILIAVTLVVVLPWSAIFRISIKPICVPEVMLHEDIRGDAEAPGDVVSTRQRLRNSLQDQLILAVALSDTLREGLTVTALNLQWPRVDL